ncbi:MAG TPA: phosphoribosylaminoimidazolesuccinocarboxamide synthase [Candidatus Norongarragalinales archaeon]|nr:phosphoribosylaminoimidazolesuccinocarboxamide synthase [Candidatus Norongarragalinales archaeon]
MQLGAKIAEGKTKLVYQDPSDAENAVLFFKDDITAGDGAKHDILKGKGMYDWETTKNCFMLLKKHNIASHYVSAPEENYLVVRKMKMIPLECVVRRIATGSLIKRLPFKEGTIFNPLLFELFLKDDSLHDPFINDEHAIALKVANQAEIDQIRDLTKKVFVALEDQFAKQAISLVDLKLEFGRDAHGGLLVGDDITNNAWRIWPEGKKEKMLDKQLYREGKVGMDAVLEGFRIAADISKKFI